MTTWVLLRGLSREAAHWGDFARQLGAMLGPHDRVVALDLPGTGQYHRERSPATVKGIAAVCRARLGAQAEPPYVLVALSLGGMVALEWAHEAPESVAGCVLINTSLRGYSPFWQRLRPRNYLRLLGVLLPGMPRQRRETAVLAMTSAVPGRHPRAASAWAEIARLRPVGIGNVARQLLAAACHAPRWGAVQVPVLVLASRGDGLVSHECSVSLASRHSLALRMHAWAGHDLPLDDGAWVAREVARWWGGAAGAPAGSRNGAAP